MTRTIKSLFSNKILWILLILFFMTIGFFLNFFSFHEGIDFGDGSTFYAFAHNIANGEVIYKDFIHFRTPGSYFLNSLMLTLLGDSYGSLKFALGFESQVLYPLIFLLSIAIFLRFKKPLIGFLTGSLIVFLPAFAQLRSALALLAVALYIHARRSKRKNLWLIVSGIVAGLSFTFGQEAGLIAMIALVFSEVIIETKSIIDLFTRVLLLVLRIAVGFLIGILPLLIYIVSVSDIGNFLYYTLYYAFILQPQSMDLIFPVLSYETAIYYFSFIVYFFVFMVSFFLKKKDWALTILLGFIILRSITLLGRSDFGHLVFILPEIFFILLYAFIKLKDVEFNKKSFLQFIVPAIAFIVSIILAIQSSTFFILFSVIILLVAIRIRPESIKGNVKYKILTIQLTTFVLAGLLILLAYWMYPSYMSTYNLTRQTLNTESIKDVRVDPLVKQQVSAVEAAVQKHQPNVIFSYPIQPYYYTLAPHHATRFMTFELQTTSAEQQQAITDLEKNKPDVVILDPTQAKDLDAAVGEITKYINRHYRVDTVVNYTKELWVMKRI